MKKNIVLYLLIAVLFIWNFYLSTRSSDPSTTTYVNEVTVQGFSTDLTKVYADNASKVVTISAGDIIQSGMVYSQSGESVYILSCYHGIANYDEYDVLFGETYSAKGNMLGYDIYTDIAVLEVNTPYTIDSVTLGDATLLKQGEFVLSAGTAGSLDYIGSLELGIVSLNHTVLDNSITYDGNPYNYFIDVISFTSNLRSGYSGSPLFNMDGQVVGISTMSSSNTRFAVTVNEAKIIADSIISGNPVNRNNLGIKVSFIKDLMNYEKSNLGLSIDYINGAYVKDVKEGSVMSLLGIQTGDIILSVNDINVDDFDSYLSAVYLDTTEFSVNYIRDGVTGTLSLSRTNDQSN
ncbi:MAG: S1C family serine protease [Erysipelotrichaceae bacterium]|nr:S1C family serine protease [Erysipelotrichaceae bacterium]